MAVGGFGADIIHIGVLHHDAARATGCLIPIVPHQTLGNSAIHVAHTGGLGCLEDAVLEGQGADLGRGEQVGEHLGHNYMTSLLLPGPARARLFFSRRETPSRQKYFKTIDNKTTMSYDTEGTSWI